MIFGFQRPGTEGHDANGESESGHGKVGMTHICGTNVVPADMLELK